MKYILLFFLLLVGCGSNVVEMTEKWNDIRANDVAKTSDEWGTPELLSFSNNGWEEGGYISSDGNTFYYIYTNRDVFRLLFHGDEKKVGPIFDTNSCTHPLNPNPHGCGVWPRADHFFVEKTEDGWTDPKPHPLTLNYPIGGLHIDGNTAYFMSGFDDDIEDIGFATIENGIWSGKEKIEIVSSEYTESDPFVKNNEMFFWSNRPAKFAGNNIYHSVKINGEWQEPELLPEPINSNKDDMQTFVYDGYLYFSSNKDGGPFSIYRSKRNGSSYEESEIVIQSKFAVGEPTITADGEYLYFEQIFTDGKNFNPDHLRVKRIKK